MKISIILLFITILSIHYIEAQSVLCLTKSKFEWQETRENILKNSTGDPNTVEIVRIKNQSTSRRSRNTKEINCILH